MNYDHGAATLSFVASKLWETIPSELHIKTILCHFLQAIQAGISSILKLFLKNNLID